jgi:hypothetical protein
MGAFRNPRETSIDDPYRRSFAQTEQIAAQVESALVELAKRLGLPPRREVDDSMQRSAVPVPDCSPGHSR